MPCKVLSMKLIPYLLQWTNPFTSLGFGLGTNWFEREIQRAILQIRINGLGIENEQLFSQN